MSGALLQLAALGSQDVYLTGNPEISLFKSKYFKHTHFSTETFQFYFDGGSINFGENNSSTCTLEKSGDLIHKIILVIKLDKISDENVEWGYVNRLGHAIIDEISITVGQNEIDMHFGDWINNYHDLYKNSSHENNYNKMIGNIPELKIFSKSHNSYDLYIPLNFWLCKNANSAFPICALQNQQVQIKLKLKSAIECINYKKTTPPSKLPNIASAFLLVDYIFLDSPELNLFNTQDHEYIIEQVQDMTESVNFQNNRYNLIFDKPCKYLMWHVNLNRYFERNQFLTWAPDDNWEKARENFAKLIWLSTRENLDVSDISNPVIKITNFINIGEQVPNISNGINNLELLQKKVKAIFLFADKNIFNENEFLAKATIDNVILLENNITKEDMSNDISYLKFNKNNSSIHNTQSTFLDLNTISIIDMFNMGNFIDRTDSPIVKSSLLLNGKNRFLDRDYYYFNYLNPYYYFDNSPQEGVHIYNFSLNPMDTQPSGTINMTHVESKELIIKVGKNNSDDDNNYFNNFFKSGRIRIFGYSYTLLKISPKNDLIGLSY